MSSTMASVTTRARATRALNNITNSTGIPVVRQKHSHDPVEYKRNRKEEEQLEDGFLAEGGSEPSDKAQPTPAKKQKTGSTVQHLDTSAVVLDLTIDEVSPTKHLLTALTLSEPAPHSHAQEYAPNIFRHWFHIEATTNKRRSNYIQWQDSVTPDIRSQLIDSLMFMCFHLNLKAETLHLAVYVLDSVMSIYKMQRDRLRALTVSSLHIAAKYSETEPPFLKEYAHVLRVAFTKTQIIRMEEIIMNALNFEVTYPSSHLFAVGWIAHLGMTNHYTLKYLTAYILELSLTDYGMLVFPNSTISAAAVFCAWDILNIPQALKLDWHWKLNQAELKPAIAALRALIVDSCAGGTKGRIVQSKYRLDTFGKVAELAENVVRTSS